MIRLHKIIWIIGLAAAITAGCSSTPTQESTGQYIDDSVITNRVRAALVEDSNIHSANIKVSTFKGVVQLSGFADSKADIAKAVHIAFGIKGVKSVQNDISLK